MADPKKQRMSLLDNIAAVGAVPLAQSMMSTNRALRSARDAVDHHRVWELDPASIDDTRFKDRLNLADVLDLKASIEANGQAVPILVRRDPVDSDRYLLVYGRRRLEAVRASDQVTKVRALIATMDDQTALRAQVTENTARRDLSYIERALFAAELQSSGFGNQSQIADVLNTTKSAISMALSLAEGIGADLARAIGPAHGIGRPRWEALLADIQTSDLPKEWLIEVAQEAHARHDGTDARDPSLDAFTAVARLVSEKPKAPALPASDTAQTLTLAGQEVGQVSRKGTSLKFEVKTSDADFLDWVAASAQDILDDLHQRWKDRSK